MNQSSKVGPTAVLRHTFTLGVADFNHSRKLPASTLIRYASEARYVAFATWPALGKMLQEDGKSMQIRTQIVRFTSNATKLAPGATITVVQSPHAIGMDNLTIACEFSGEGGDAFAQVFTLLARVSNTDGTLLQLPPYVGEEIVWQYNKQEDMQHAKDQAWLYDLLFAKASNVPSVQLLPALHRVLVRASDVSSSSNGQTVRSSRLTEYFEDALAVITQHKPDNATPPVPDLLVVEMMQDANITPNQECDVVSVVDDGNEVLLLLLDHNSRKILARNYVHWQYKLITQQ